MLERSYLIFILVLQFLLIVYFAIRRWQAPFAYRIGKVIYYLGWPVGLFAVAAVIMGLPWQVLVGGVFFVLWSILGIKVDIGRPLKWYEPICPGPFNGYIVVFTLSQLFFWWALALIGPTGARIFTGVLFVMTLLFNIISRSSPYAVQQISDEEPGK